MRYTADEVVKKVEGLNSEGTLRRWTSVVRQHFGCDYFKVDKVKKHAKDVYRKVLLYTDDDVRKFQHLVHLLAKQKRKNLDEAVINAFSGKGEYIKIKEPWEVLIDEVTTNIGLIEKENERLLQAIQQLNRQVDTLTERMQRLKRRKPKLFE